MDICSALYCWTDHGAQSDTLRAVPCGRHRAGGGLQPARAWQFTKRILITCGSFSFQLVKVKRMWKCIKCDTYNRGETCVVCGHMRSSEDEFEEVFFIEKLANDAILLEDFGVLPDLARYNIDSSAILQLLHEIEFNMDTIIESYQYKTKKVKRFLQTGLILYGTTLKVTE